MLARLAIVDPALTDGCPRAVTLASGLDAITQVIEPSVCSRATAFTDALCLRGGLSLANSGLGAVLGLAGEIGGLVPAPHGASCGVLLGPVLAVNRARATGVARAA